MNAHSVHVCFCSLPLADGCFPTLSSYGSTIRVNSLHWRSHVWDAEFVWYPDHHLASSIGCISSCLATIGSKETTNCSADGGLNDRFCIISSSSSSAIHSMKPFVKKSMRHGARPMYWFQVSTQPLDKFLKFHNPLLTNFVMPMSRNHYIQADAFSASSYLRR